MASNPTISDSAQALRIEDLRLVFHTYAGEVKALDGIRLEVKKGEILGLVGESGCGKSVTALAIAGLLPENAEVVSGAVMIDGRDLLHMSKNDVRDARSKDIAFVFQDPMTYLNPVISVGSQLTEALTDNKKAHMEMLLQLKAKGLDQRIKADPSDLKAKQERERLNSPGTKLGGREASKLARLKAIEYLNLVRLPEPERIFKMYPFELSGGMR